MQEQILKQKSKLDETEEAIVNMLTENTGTHFLDSGGAYGRNWERNQERDFKSEPPIKAEVYKDEVVITKNVFHFLNRFLLVTKKSKKYQRLLDMYEKGHYTRYLKMTGDVIEKYARARGYITGEEKTWIQVMEEFADIHDTGNEFNSGIYNTYNGDDMLSQTLQFCFFENEDGEFIILQIHQGADVRGGYGTPKIFEASYEDIICAKNDIDAKCDCCSWYSDDCGYHWYLGEDFRDDGLKQLDLNGNKANTEPDFSKLEEFDEENNKVTCKRCGKEIKFWG